MLTRQALPSGYSTRNAGLFVSTLLRKVILPCNGQILCEGLLKLHTHHFEEEGVEAWWVLAGLAWLGWIPRGLPNIPNPNYLEIWGRRTGEKNQTAFTIPLPPPVSRTMSDDGTGQHKDKKQKMADFPVAPDEEWPEAWLMPDTVEDQCKPNKLEPNVPVTPAQMKDLGISYWKMDAESFEYPVKSVPWDPKDATDPKLKALRDARGYSYADIITVHPDHLPEFEKKIEAFFEEHIHDAEEIRYILGGSGYFDVRNKDDKWVRVHVKKGDLMTLPEGIYHRFTCDEDRLIHAMRLFIGQPVWTPFNRPQEEHESRKKYVEAFLEPVKA